MKNYSLLLSICWVVFGCQSAADQTIPIANNVFQYGVASGDPLPDGVVLWTKAIPVADENPINVKWQVSKTDEFKTIEKSGEVTGSAENDYTIKVNVSGLDTGQVYYYRFQTQEGYSPVGRTKTASQQSDSLRFAVVSCSNYEWGYFTAYKRIAEKEILDAVIHLGDYIYEYAPGGYGDTTLGRLHSPANELLTLQDYRMRYAQYRSDPDLQSVHQQHPFISIWDDHEIANNSYKEGAQNHQPEEGDYQERKAAAIKAYYEWMPIRETEGPLYRSFSFGDLADLIMLDERLEGRSKQPESQNDPLYRSTESSMLGQTQLDWMTAKLQGNSTWKIIGNQVMYSDIDQSPVLPKSPKNLDSWSGYPNEKNQIARYLKDNNLKNLIFVTGDTHATWAMEVLVKEVSLEPLAMEFGTPSINSANYDEYTSLDTARMAENLYQNFNPHLKYANLSDHGYLLLTVTPKRTTARYYYVETVKQPDAMERMAKKFWVNAGVNAIEQFSLY